MADEHDAADIIARMPTWKQSTLAREFATKQPITLADLNAMRPANADTWLRRAVTRVLEPENKKPACVAVSVCKEQAWYDICQVCPIIPEAQGSWAEIEIQLRDKYWVESDRRWYVNFVHAIRPVRNRPGILGQDELWYIFEATARERVICLLIALGMVKI